MLSVNVPLTLVAVAPIPFIYVVGVRMRELMFPISWVVQARAADVATIVEENVTGARVVKSFAAEAQQVDALALAARRLRWGSIRQIDVRAQYAPLLEALPRLGLAAVLALRRPAGHRRRGHRRHARRLQRLRRAPAGAVPHARLHADARPAGGGVGRADLRDPRHRGRDRRPAGRGGPGRAARRGGAARRHVPLRRGRAGARAPRPAPGARRDGGAHRAHRERQVHDRPAAAALLRRVRRARCSSTATTCATSPCAACGRPSASCSTSRSSSRASVRENIAYGRPDASDEEVRAAARAAGAEEFIDALPEGFDSEVGERGYTLSGGQRQRVAIARTLLDDPAILILDDATSAIDVQVEEEIHAALRVLMEGRTTLVIAHRLSTINLAERVVLLEGGRIVADGTHAGLMATEPRYAEVLAHIEEDDATPPGARRGGRRAGGRSAPPWPTPTPRRPRPPGWETSADGLGRRWRSAARPGGFGGGRGGAAAGCRSPACRRSCSRGSTSCSSTSRTTTSEHVTYEPVAARRRAVLAPPAARCPTGWRWPASVALVVLETVALQAGPLLTQIAIDDGIRAGRPRRRPRRRRRSTWSASFVGRGHQPDPHRVDRPGGRAAALRPAGQGVQPLPAALDRLLLPREGRVG